MTGYRGEVPKERPKLRSVYDTVRAVNERVQRLAPTKDELFLWTEKTIARNF